MKDKQEENSGGSYKIKGAAESVKQEKKDLNKMPGDVKQMDTPPARKKGAAASKPDANGDGIPDYAQDGVGVSRMGFTQNFGAARQNSYAKGAAKVASIMSFGASKKKGAADETGSKHSHEASSTSSSAPSLTTTSPTTVSSIGNKIGGSFSSNFSNSLNTPIEKAPTLTGNSYAGHSSASEIQTQMENPTQLTDENPYVYSPGYTKGRSDDNKASQLHKLSGDESRLTQEKRAGYLEFNEKNKLGPIMTEGNNPNLKSRHDKITSALTSNTLVPPLSRNYR